MRLAAYVAVAIALALFGYLALFSIGSPFLLTGLLMLALVRLRRRVEVMVPALLWPWAFYQHAVPTLEEEAISRFAALLERAETA